MQNNNANDQKPIKKSQMSGAANAKIKALKTKLDQATKQLEIQEIKNSRKVDALSIMSSWNAEAAKASYGGTFDYTNKPRMTPEEIEKALEIPVYGVPPPRQARAIADILQQQTTGFFLSPADFTDAMLRDDRIFALLHVRINSLIGAGFNLVPGDETPKAKEIQEVCAKHFADMVPVSEMSEMLRWGIVLGNSISQINWNTSKDGLWIPRMNIFHPRYMFYNWGVRQMQLSTMNEAQIVIYPEDIGWNLFTPYTDHLPWLRGAILPLAMLYLQRFYLKQWWQRSQERTGSPILGAVTSAEATPEEEAIFLQQVFALNSNAAIRLPQGVDGNKFDLKIIQPQSDLYQGFEAYLDYIDKCIAILLLGQDKTTSSKGGAITIGNEGAGEEVRLDIMRFDANAISCNLREKILKPFVRFNFGEEFEELAPFIHWNIEEVEDMNVKGNTLFAMSQGLEKLVANPVVATMIDFRELLNEFDMPLNDIGDIDPIVKKHLDEQLQQKKDVNNKSIKE
jgi:phage gp29-like protein